MRAAGTGGVEVTPLPAYDASGHQVTSFHLTASGGHAIGTFELRNLTGAPVSARLYGAQVTLGADHAATVGDAASGSWLGIRDTTVTLAPHETRTVQFTAAAGTQRELGAVVVEQTHGTVVERAATLVTVDRGHGATAAGVAGWAAACAAVLALLVGAGHLIRCVREKRA